MQGVPPASHHHSALVPAIFLLAIAALAIVASPAPAADVDDLRQLEQQLEADRERAAALERERRKAAEAMAKLRRETIAAAKKAQRHEARLIELEATLKDLGRREDAARASLHERNREMTGTLAALERISRNPPQTMLSFPDAPTRMVRSAMLLGSALPRLREDADALAAELQALDRIRQETRVKLVALEDETVELDRERRRLSTLLERKATLLEETDAERREVTRRVQELSKRAKSIRELLAQIEAERKRREEEAARRRREAEAEAQRSAALAPPQAGPDMALAKPDGLRPFPSEGPIALPTSAPIVRRYGERNAMGQTERGITFATRAGAQIVAPHDGQVVFAGPFEGYRQILIIEHDGGYHTLLAGLDRLDTSVGMWVLAGEPVGAAAGGRTDALGGTQGLYLELRRKGQPINPWRWIAGAIQNRTSG